MKYALTMSGLMMVLVFGAISLVDNSPTASGAQVTATVNCNDDGDDDLPSNPEPVDGPDSEDNDSIVPGERNDELADPEDHDPSYEEDDNADCEIGGVQGDTATPEPCPSIRFTNVVDNCCPDTSANGGNFTCICPDSAGGDVSAEFTCSCEHGQPLDCLCEFGIPPCGFSLSSSADADCDGGVTPMDAYETLVVLSGFQSSGDCGGGDADCNDAVDAKDTLAILAVVAGLAEAPAC